MRIVVIGGTGHIGTYLVPSLVMAGHEVTCVSRNHRQPYQASPSWQFVNQVDIDRDLADKEGDFGSKIRELNADIVIDLICFTTDSAAMLAEALLGHVQHFLHCGTIWVHGHSEAVPTLESQKRTPFGSYGIQKAKIEAYLLDLARLKHFPVTILHPGHITGPGWLPINPAGNLNPETFTRLARGQSVTLPNLGMETLHHVHASDVALAFVKAIDNKERAVGESFHVVSEQALTLRGFALAMGEWFGHDAQLSFLPWEAWKKTVDKTDADLTWDHIAHSPNASISKAKKLLDFHPKYSSLEAVQEAVRDHFTKENISI